MANFAILNAIMPGKSPYDPQLKEKVLELFKKGVSVKDIAEVTGLPSRTVYRWTSVYSTKPIEPDKISVDPNFQMALKAKVMPHSKATKWLDDVEDTIDRHGSIHSNLIDDLLALLQRAITASDVSPRCVNTLSLCLARHMEMEMKCVLQGRDKLVDINQAISVLESYGFSVFDSARLKAMFEGDAPPLVDAPTTEANDEHEQEAVYNKSYY